MIDYHLHVVAHADRPMTVENILEYCEVAKSRGIRELGITEHDRFLDDIDLEAFREAKERSQDVALRLGIEVDFVPGKEAEMERFATALPYDYVIGSVHRVGGAVEESVRGVALGVALRRVCQSVLPSRSSIAPK